MLKYLFSGLGLVMFLVLIISYLITGKFSELNIHLSAYGFILAGLGYIIETLKRREQDAADHLKYILNKNQKELVEEIKSIRTMVFKMQSRTNDRSMIDDQE